MNLSGHTYTAGMDGEQALYDLLRNNQSGYATDSLDVWP